MVTAMFAAAQSGDALEIRRLVAAGADVEELGDLGRRPMHEAALHGHVNVIQTLAELGAKLDPRDNRDNTPYFLANIPMANQSTECNRVCMALDSLGMEHPGDVLVEPVSYAPDGTPQYVMPPELKQTHAWIGGDTSWQRSQAGGNFADGRPFKRVRAIAKAMFDQLMRASAEGNVGLIRELVAGGIRLEAEDGLGWRPIHIAAERGQLESVRTLAQLGAALNPPDQQGIVPLVWAAKQGHVKTVKLFLELGVDIDELVTIAVGASNRPLKMTALHHTVLEDKLGPMRILARCGANVNATDEIGQRPVHMAAMNDRAEAMHLLWELGADLKAPYLPPASVAVAYNLQRLKGLDPLQLSCVFQNSTVEKLIAGLEGVSPPQPGACAACGADGGGDAAAAFKKCARCRDVKYCRKECQRLHWRVHKASCVAVSGK
jgi:ankyrin repeat protein